MLTSAGDQELLARQAALQAEGAEVLAGLDLGSLFGDLGPVLVVGSYVLPPPRVRESTAALGFALRSVVKRR